MITCPETGKRAFATEREALDELARITKRAILGERVGYARHLENAVYFCTGCGGFHLTSKPRTGEISA